MHASAYLRRFSRQFSISAPRMAVRTYLGWPWRIGLVLGLAALVGGMWWWGFDFGQLLGGFNRREIEAQVATLVADVASAQAEARELRAQNMQLESDLAMMRGLQASLHKQQADAVKQNALLKDELAFLQSFFADASKSPGPGIHRLDIDADGGEIARYSILMVRGGQSKAEFDGQLALQADVVPTAAAPSGSEAMTVVLPDGRPESLPQMKLRFRHYQRLEGTFRVPPGYAVRAVTARAYESGVASPRATRTLTLR